MNTTYAQRRSSYSSVSSPRTAPQEQRSPVQAEMAKYLRDYELTASFEEDRETQALLKHVPNTIAFRCILKKDGKIVGIGKGTSFLSRTNRYIDRAVSYTAHASLIDAMVRAVKTIEALDAGLPDIAGSIESSFPKSPEAEPMSEKQRQWLITLAGNVSDEDEREEWMNRISTMTRKEASEAIQVLRDY